MDRVSGRMGEVYRARDTTLGREVAIKVLPGDENVPEVLAAIINKDPDWKVIAARSSSRVEARSQRTERLA